MKKQSSRARAQESKPPVRHQLEHEVPTVIHDPEQDMTALARWVNHAMLEPGRYLGWPVAIIVGLILLLVVFRLTRGTSATESDLWTKLYSAQTPAEQVEIARKEPKTPATAWAKLQAATEFLRRAMGEMPEGRDEALQSSKKALELFEEVGRDAEHDSPPARIAALGKGRALELRNELSRAIEQYRLVAKEWPESPEAAEARGYAEALQDPGAAAFYKELYAYVPPKMDLPPLGTGTLTSPGSPSTGGTTPVIAPPGNSVLSPGIDAIPEIREVLAPRLPAKDAASKTAPMPGAAAPKTDAPKAPAETVAPKGPENKVAPAAPKAETPKPAVENKPAAPAPAPKATENKPAGGSEKKDLPPEVFAPKSDQSRPK